MKAKWVDHGIYKGIIEAPALSVILLSSHEDKVPLTGTLSDFWGDSHIGHQFWQVCEFKSSLQVKSSVS